MSRRIAAAALLAAIAATAAPAHADPTGVMCIKASAYALRYYSALPKICVPYVDATR